MNYKLAFRLALLSNVILLSFLTLLIAKSPANALPRLEPLKNSSGNATSMLYMQTQEAIYVQCLQDGVDKGDLDITQGRLARVLFCAPGR
jgi:hypothetical protein